MWDPIVINIVAGILACAIGYGFFKIVSLYKASKRRDWFREIRESINNEHLAIDKFAEEKLMNMDIPEGCSVVIFEPENEAWASRAEYVVGRIEQLITQPNDCPFCGVSCVPVRVGFYPMEWISAMALRLNGKVHKKEDKPCIVLSENLLKEGTNEELDDTIAHECAHILVCDMKTDSHGDEWKFYYQALLKQAQENPLELVKK